MKMKMDKARIERRIDFLLSQTKSIIYDYINKHEDFKKAWKHIGMLKKGKLHPTVQLLKQNIDKMIDTSFEFSTRSTESLCEMYKNELFNNIYHFKECDDSDDEYDVSEYMTTPPTYNVVYNAMPSFHRGMSFEIDRFQTRIRPIYDEVVAEYSRIIESVLLIQRAWRNAISNPTHKLCRTRLLKEFALGVTSRAEGPIPQPNSYLGNLVEGGMLQALPRFLIRNAKQKATDMKGQRLFKAVVQHPETFTYSPPEETFYELMSEFILAGKAYATSLSRTEGGQVMLVLIALQKLASSSIAAVVAALQTRIKRLGAEAAKSKSELAAIDEGEGDEAQQALQRWLRDEKQARLRLMEDEGRYLSDLIAAADQVTSETRIVRIIEVIKQRFGNEPVLLFTEYKRTQALVISALMAEFGQGAVGFMNGDDRLEGIRLPDGRLTQLAGRREDMCDAFNAGRIRFLVSTEAGGEGIDLQERCSALIHVDLPWNPMRLHQRVGRLNRYGQQRPVEVVSLRNPDTVEAMIWQKLEQKLNSIMRALGSAMDEPEDLMQLVLGMSGEGLFDDLFSGAISVKREKLDAWFDNTTGTLGGESAIQTVRDLIGHAESFDLSDLKDVPPVDLPDLMPFFQNVLTLNRRRPKVEGAALSFRTPEDWLTSHAIRKSYDNLVFDRKAPSQADLMGIGHPLLEKALHQAERLAGTVCAVDGLDDPMMVVDVSSRVTDVATQSRRAIVGITGSVGSFRLLRDWEVLRSLNRCNLKSESPDGAFDTEALTSWRSSAMSALNDLLDTVDLQFGSRVVKESALVWTTAK